MTQIPKPNFSENTRTINVPESQLKKWLQMLEEMAQGVRINTKTDHTKNMETAYQKMINMSSELAREFAEVVEND